MTAESESLLLNNEATGRRLNRPERRMAMPNIIESTIEVFKPKTEAQALKPCPFCGGTEIVYERYLHMAGERYRVWCEDCTAGVDPGYARDIGTVQNMWNRRV